MDSQASGMGRCLTHCRNCGASLDRVFVDLGLCPLANSYLDTADQLEVAYPLRVMVCESCFLVQLQHSPPPDVLFADYAYFTSYSPSALEHARNYAHMVAERFHLTKDSLVLEVASNDGYLLQYFAEQKIPVLGIEPAENVASTALHKGIPTRVQFFSKATAKAMAAEGKTADLLVANNVLAHVPDLHDFVEGLKLVLKPGGVITAEFPHLLRLMENTQFDTIYHEHICYFSFTVVEKLFAFHALRIFDVEELPTHGGSLRIYASVEAQPTPAVVRLRNQEQDAGLDKIKTYDGFSEKVEERRRELRSLLSGLKQQGKHIAGFGAPAKGNTLLNFCGIGSDVIDYTVDDNPCKQGKFLPGSRIPVVPPSGLRQTKPDYVLVLPWNLLDYVMKANSDIRSWGGQFIVPIPKAEIA